MSCSGFASGAQFAFKCIVLLCLLSVCDKESVSAYSFRDHQHSGGCCLFLLPVLFPCLPTGMQCMHTAHPPPPAKERFMFTVICLPVYQHWGFLSWKKICSGMGVFHQVTHGNVCPKIGNFFNGETRIPRRFFSHQVAQLANVAGGILDCFSNQTAIPVSRAVAPGTARKTSI